MNRALLAIGVLAAVAGLGAMAWFTLGPRGSGGAGSAPPVSAPPVVPAGPGAAAELTDATFDAAVARGVALVECYAPKLPVSAQQRPVTERLAARYAGRALVARLDAERNRRTAGKLQVGALPVLFVLRDGQQLAKFVGLEKEEALAAALDKALAGG